VTARRGPANPLQRLRALLLVNRHWEQIVIKNMVWATLAEAVVRGLKLAVLPLIARVFGPAEFGKFAFAFSFASVFNIVFDAGLATTTTRELAMTEKDEALLPDILLMKLGLGVLGIAALVLGIYLITGDPLVRAMIVVLGVAFFVLELVNLTFSVFRARQRMEYEFLVRVAQAVFLVAAVALVAWKAPSILNVSYAYLVSGVLTLAVVAAGTRGKVLRIRTRVRAEAWRRIFGIAVPLALASGATTAYMNLDSILLGYFGKITDTGWYNLAGRLVGLLLVPTGLLTLVIFPAFASTAGDVNEMFRRRWERWSTGMVALGTYLASVVFATADPLVRLVFGPAFGPTGAALRILAITVVMIFVYTPSVQAMIVFDRQRTLFWSLLSGAAVNVVLNVALIPAYGLYGAAWATVATHAVLLCELLILTPRCTPVRPASRAVMMGAVSAAVSGTLAYAAMSVTRDHLWLAVPLGSAVFAACLVGLDRSRALPAAAGFRARW
jgi:O-antigen/teichoic acid export membrane protein